ncbi:TatD family hydrolase [Omnitrophica bacterium]|nr:TatD family hydrolase [Candidatus Omnitrophota bacterium]
MKLIDTHVHLHFPDFDSDRTAMIERARRAGVEKFITVGTDLTTSRQALELAESHTDVFAAAGIHPHEAGVATEQDFQGMTEILKHPKVVALGEVGLDFFRNHSSREDQERIFRRFLKIHSETGKPLIIHCRDAYEHLEAVLRDELPMPVAGVMHCFSSDAKRALKFLEMGFYISFAGTLTYKKNDELREACAACPVEKLLVETDAPYLAPQPQRGKRNEPAFVAETLKEAARVKQMPAEQLGPIILDNARKLFRYDS